MTDPINGASKHYKPVGIFWGYMLAAVTTTVFIVFVLVLVATHVFDFSFVSDAACRKVTQTLFYESYTYCFYGTDWDEETYLAAVSGFYSTLIAVLVAVQALVSWLAFTVIKSSNKQAISEEVEKEVPYFFKTKDAERVLKDALEQAAEEALSKLRKEDEKSTEALQQTVYDELQPAFEGLRGEIEELRVQLDEYTGREEEYVDGKKGKISE